MSQGFPIAPSTRLSGPYTATEGQTAFSVTFPFQANDDLAVQVRANAAANWTAALLGTDYSVTGAGATAGGGIAFGTGRAGGSQVRILGLAPIAALLDAVPAGAFDNETFNRLFDRIVIWMQEARRDIADVQARVSETGTVGWSPMLAVVTDGERRVLQVADWTGGAGTKPATGSYIGAAGFVPAVADAVNVRGATGAQGPGGPTGGTGPQGPEGPTGATGAPGAQGPVGPAGATGPQGPAGAAGAGVSIKGSLPNTGALPSSGAAGDAWLIGGNLYVWTGTAWENVGTIQGPAGPTGATGAEGPQGPAGPTGAQGPTGPAGPGLPTGGAIGAIPVKASATSYDVTWTAPTKALVGLGNVDNTTDALKPISTAQAAVNATKSNITRSIRQVSGTAASLEAGDAGNVVEITSASAKTLTILNSSSVAFATGTQIDVLNDGGGALTVVADSGVAIVSAGSLTFSGTINGLTLVYKGDNIWLLVGS